MIPADVNVGRLVYFDEIDNWGIDIVRTQWVGYWIIELTHKSEPPLRMMTDLIHLEQMRRTLDWALEHMGNPVDSDATHMHIVLASAIATEEGQEGQIDAVACNWSEELEIVLDFRRACNQQPVSIRGSHYIAMDLHACLDEVYRAVPDKDSWTPRFDRPSETRSA